MSGLSLSLRCRVRGEIHNLFAFPPPHPFWRSLSGVALRLTLCATEAVRLTPLLDLRPARVCLVRAQVRLKDYIAKKETGSLRMDKFQKRMNTALQKVRRERNVRCWLKIYR